MFSKFSYYLIDFCLMLLGGSDYAIYSPLSHDMPMLQAKYDMRADLDLSLVGATASMAYAFDDHWGIQGAFQGIAFPAERVGGQLAAGWFTPINRNAVLEVYAGTSVGHGWLSTADLDSYNSPFQSYFIQADYGWCGLANSHIDIALGLKGGYLHAKGTFRYLDTNSEYVASPWSCSGPLLEPTVTFRFGWERLKFNLNANMTFLHEKEKDRITILGRTGLGLNYYFNTKKPKAE